MRFIFCADYWDIRRPDATYEAEVEAVQNLGYACSFIDFEALAERRDVARTLRTVEPASTRESAIYRGWMLKPQQYELLYQALEAKGIDLINSLAAYKHCHYLPEWYPLLAKYTPASTWLTGPDFSLDAIMEALRPFGEQPVIVKDFVKSRKHEWFEACYIPSAADRVAAERVVGRFLQLQAEDLNEGLVFREFVEFEPLATHSKSGMPLTREYRLFVLDGQVMLAAPYWEEGEYADDEGAQPPLEALHALTRKVQSRFFTMDVARRKSDGAWLIVELGDGQVAGLPERAEKEAFYQALAGRAGE
jgi:hypothetical protein